MNLVQLRVVQFCTKEGLQKEGRVSSEEDFHKKSTALNCYFDIFGNNHFTKTFKYPIVDLVIKKWKIILYVKSYFHEMNVHFFKSYRV